MKIQNYFYSCILFFFITTVSSFALGKAASMGNLQTVVPSGPFDTARNPALLAPQTQANSTGLFYTYIMHLPKENFTETNQHLNDPTVPFEGGLDSDTKQKDPEIYGMNGHIANTTKSANYTIGFEITDNGNDQYLVTKNETSAERLGTDGANGTMVYNKSNEKVTLTEINPALISSLGFSMSNTTFFGLQLILGYSNRNEERKSHVENFAGPGTGIGDLPANIPEFYEKREKEEQKISGEFGFGYLYKKNGQQFGFLLKTGELSWIEKKLTNCRDNVFPSVNTLKADSKIKSNAKYTSGPAITAGAYKKISTYFALAFESGMEFENSYIDKDLEYNEKNNTVEEQKNSNNIKNIYSLKAGLEINPSNNLAVMMGFGYMTGVFSTSQYKEKDTFSRQLTGEMDIRYGISTFGIQYILNKNITFDFITAIIAYRKELTIGMRSADTASGFESEMLVKQIDKGFFLHTGLGVTISF
ncbi:MAG: hypothetical protein JXN64_08080 [Spirochaetes bacterium]|nr:hypothetical protein [Spirochaetota bacterium]